MSLSDYGENYLLSYIKSSGTKYLGLHTTTPGESTAGAEVTGNGYARQAIALGTPAGGAVSNTANIQFPTATGSWGTVRGFGVFDAATGGNLIWYGTLTDQGGTANPKAVTAGDIMSVQAGDLTLTLD